MGIARNDGNGREGDECLMDASVYDDHLRWMWMDHKEKEKVNKLGILTHCPHVQVAELSRHRKKAMETTTRIRDGCINMTQPSDDSKQVNVNTLRPHGSRETTSPPSKAHPSPIKNKAKQHQGNINITRQYLYKYKKNKFPFESWIASSCLPQEQQSSCLPLSSLRVPCRREPFRR